MSIVAGLRDSDAGPYRHAFGIEQVKVGRIETEGESLAAPPRRLTVLSHRNLRQAGRAAIEIRVAELFDEVDGECEIGRICGGSSGRRLW